ncbi:hypothetical protein GGU10DRAFT_343147 [Lentinula aff. detonsa]|uniref:Secreted protein n=1 Tax=Lentinula aff. detonsa TaxID=2804958 RepID=A0AA38TYF3_9AGAR|nr:hypothetical protein GGU10DRAFT_343147 [Lentinula aff. detonsa]
MASRQGQFCLTALKVTLFIPWLIAGFSSNANIEPRLCQVRSVSGRFAMITLRNALQQTDSIGNDISYFDF